MNLVFHQAALGDFALILPLLGGLEGRTTLVAPWSRGRLAAAMVDGLTAMDIEMFEFTRLHRDGGPTSLSPAIKELFEQARHIVSFVSRGDDAWAANVTRWAPQASVTCLATRPPAEGEPIHVADWHRRRLAEAGVVVNAVSRPVTGDPDGPVVIHPGSGGRAKCWPAERFAELIERYRASGRPVRVLYGEAEAERWPAEQLQAWRSAFGAEGCGSLERLVERLLGASRYIGNGAGPTHLAAQLGLPTTALFGPTDPRVWAPRGPSVDLVAPAEPRPMDWLTTDDLAARLGLDR